METNGTWDEPVSGFIELDAAKNGADLNLTEDNRITLEFGFNGNLVDASSVYVDNIRLLDTYAPGRGPSELVLEGFENESFETLVASGFEVFSYTRADDADLNVTEGNRSARIEVFDGGWTTTSTLDLTLSDELNDVLFEVPREERLNYILSFDYRVVPESDVNVSWFQLITQASGLRLSPSWGGGASRTYSINLGTVAWEEPVPVFNLITQGGFDGFVDIYIDNVRLINTQGAEAETPSPSLPPIPTVPSVPADPARITDISITEDKVVLTFTSSTNANYTILSTSEIEGDLSSWKEESGNVTGTGELFVWETSRVDQGVRFYRVRTNE